ncbi:hypothetical protein E2542_SST21596 [Spatholobus suberectus]|nr:hypothetical protein E2542_SST21596 [Spatholobus suberectus]
MAAMEQKFQLLFKTVLTQNTSGLNVAALAVLLSTPADANSALRSSTSTHAPSNIEMDNGMNEGQDLEVEDEDMDADGS